MRRKAAVTVGPFFETPLFRSSRRAMIRFAPVSTFTAPARQGYSYRLHFHADGAARVSRALTNDRHFEQEGSRALPRLTGACGAFMSARCAVLAADSRPGQAKVRAFRAAVR
jgi:hypothetical protein